MNNDKAYWQTTALAFGYSLKAMARSLPQDRKTIRKRLHEHSIDYVSLRKHDEYDSAKICEGIGGNSVKLSRDIEKVYVIPLGDMHTGDIAFNADKFKRYVSWIVDQNESNTNYSVRVILMGDFVNAAIPGSVSYSPEERQCMLKDERKLFTELVRPLVPYIDGAVLGNHDRRMGKAVGDSTIEMLFEDVLEIPLSLIHI